MNRGVALALLCAALVLLGIVLGPQELQRYRERQQQERIRQQERMNQVNYPGPDVEGVGSPNAPLKPFWVVPNGPFTKEGVATVEEVKKWVREHPNLVYLTLVRIHTPEGDRVMKANKLTCAGITVKGVSGFQVWDKQVGHARIVELNRAPGPGSYEVSDVIDVFEQALEILGHLPRNRTLGWSVVDEIIRSRAGQKQG